MMAGPQPHYKNPQRIRSHTVQVPSKPIDKDTITACVIPQFDLTAESLIPPHWKRHGHKARCSRCSNPSFVPLPFVKPQSSSSETSGTSLNGERPHQSKQQSPRRSLFQSRPKLSERAPQSLSQAFNLRHSQTPSLSQAFNLPHGQTPGPSSSREDPTSPDQRAKSLLSFFFAGDPDRPDPGPVLVADTPEKKYGIKVTWRRRKYLFAYLTATGKLSRRQFLVKI